jgi:hypothetical protein
MLRKAFAVLSKVAILSALGGAFASPSHASGKIEFSCDNSGSLPTTVAMNRETGNKLSIVRWYSEYFTGSGYDPITRCQEVTARFQRSYNDGSLNYMTAGIVNGMPVICAAQSGGSCNRGNLLFTLKRGVNAAETLQRLFDVRDLSAGPLYESGGRTYVNLKKMLAPLEGGASSATSQPSAAPSQPTRGF